MFNSCIKHLITIIPAIESNPDAERIQLRVENEQLKAQVNKLRWGVSKIKRDLGAVSSKFAMRLVRRLQIADFKQAIAIFFENPFHQPFRYFMIA